MESLPVFQVKVNEWTSEKYFDVLGMKIPVFFTPNPTLLSDVISNFQTRAEDVFVVTYPKSGLWKYKKGLTFKLCQTLGHCEPDTSKILHLTQPTGRNYDVSYWRDSLVEMLWWRHKKIDGLEMSPAVSPL